MYKQRRKEKIKEMKKTLRNNRGITLIALVITIICIAILAGIALSNISGSEGILDKTKGTINQSKIENDKTEIQRGITNAYI